MVAATVTFEVAAWLLSWGLEPRYDTVLYALYAVVQAVAGALIVSRHPRHPIGWLFLWFALFNAVVADALQGWGLRAAQAGWPAGPVAEWLALNSWILASIGLVLTFLLFPDGRLPGRGWRLVVGANLLGVALLLPGWALSPGLGEEFAAGRNPFVVPGVPTTLLFVVGNVVMCGSLVASVAALVVRFRRSQGIEREQMKWFTFAAAVVGLVLPVSAVLWSTVPAARVLPALALTALPVAASVAILRYRLYDIDLVISRTLAYGALSVALALAYVSSAVLIGTAVGSRSAWATAGATLVVALAFRPLRDRFQGAVDRRFDRARYEARSLVLRFVEELRRGLVEPEDIEDALRDALDDDGLEVRLRLPDSPLDVDLHGRPAPVGSGDEPGGRRRVPVRRGGVVVGDVLSSGAGGATAARRGGRGRGPAHRDRPPPGRAAPPARRGPALACPAGGGRRRGTPPAGARPARRCAAAPRRHRSRRCATPSTSSGGRPAPAPRNRPWRARWPRSRAPSRSCGSSPASGPACSTPGSDPPCASWRRGRPSRSRSGSMWTVASSGSRPSWRRRPTSSPVRVSTNAVKHARAAKVSLSVGRRHGAVIVRWPTTASAAPGPGRLRSHRAVRSGRRDGGTLQIDTVEGAAPR